MCPAGCCGPEPAADRGRSVQRAVELLGKTLFQSLDTPALNKWTTVGPAVSKVALQLSFYNVLERALTHSLEKRSKKRRRRQEEEEESDFGIDEIVGPDQHDVKTQRKKATRRQQIVLSFIRSQWSFLKLLMWVAICEPVMVIHFRLFKFGTWSSHSSDRRIGIFEFCSEASPAKVALRSLTGMLSPGSSRSSELQLLVQSRFGPPTSWGQAMRQCFWSAVSGGISMLWRKLILPFRSFPWRFCAFVNPDLSESQRMASGREFLQAPKCCLDDGFSLRLRKHIDAQDLLLLSLMEALVKHFLSCPCLSACLLACLPP